MVTNPVIYQKILDEPETINRAQSSIISIHVEQVTVTKGFDLVAVNT